MEKKEEAWVIPRRYINTFIPPAGAALSFCFVLHSAQIAGRCLGVSCASGGSSSLLGCLFVACGSLAAGQASFSLKKYIKHGNGRPEDFILPKELALFHVVSGLVAFKLLRGKFHNLMPSDLRKPGALAHFSLKARGSSYATEAQKKTLANAFRQDGCHHCGRRGSLFNADHMPPNVIVHGPKIKTKQSTGFFHWFFHLPKKRILQRFYPQCMPCMRKQSTALVHGKDPYVFHFKRGLPEPSSLVGFFIGIFRIDRNDSDKGSVTATSTNWD